MFFYYFLYTQAVEDINSLGYAQRLIKWVFLFIYLYLFIIYIFCFLYPQAVEDVLE